MNISKCTVSEISVTGEFYDKVVKYLDKHVNYPKWTYKAYPSEESVKAAVKENSQYLCRSKKGEIIAAFVLNTNPQGAYDCAHWSVTLADGEYLVCHALAVSPEMQGRGTGRQIVEFCKRYAKTNGYKAIRLDVVPTNFPARKLYESCDFKYVGDADLKRGIRDIPLFSMYELNL